MPKSKFCSFIIWLLKSISLGKYDSTLYFNNSTDQSSIIGGIFTLGFATTLITFSFIIFGPIFRKDSYNLDINARPHIGYERDYNNTITRLVNNCSSRLKCEALTIDDYMNISFQFRYGILKEK